MGLERVRSDGPNFFVRRRYGWSPIGIGNVFAVHEPSFLWMYSIRYTLEPVAVLETCNLLCQECAVAPFGGLDSVFMVENPAHSTICEHPRLRWVFAKLRAHVRPESACFAAVEVFEASQAGLDSYAMFHPRV